MSSKAFALSSKSYYVLETKAVFPRYKLPEEMRLVFEKYDHYKLGAVDSVELGRLMRFSSNCRAAVATTINLCAAILKKDSQELTTCIDIIEICTEVLQVTGKFLHSIHT